MQVRVENLYYLLSYAAGFFAERDLAEIGASEGRTAEDLFARVLFAESRRLLQQRLDRGYREDAEEMRRPRGKISFADTVARAAWCKGNAHCTFEEHTEDVLHNRIIKATASRLASMATVDPKLSEALQTVVRMLQGVSDGKICAADFRKVQLHSNLRRYRLALNVCELLFRCLLPEEHGGGWKFRTFAGDEREMGSLFERYVRAFLAREQRAFPTVRSSRMTWRVDGETNGLLPELRTDITLRRPGHTVVIETKCYGQSLVSWRAHSGRTLRPSDLNQLFAYLANAQGSDRVTGVLLYAVDTPCVVPPTGFRLVGHDVHVRELNIGQPWRDIERDLHKVVADLAQ